MISEDRFLKENSVIKLKRGRKVMDIMKKSLTVVVIFLFLGVAVAPSINISVVKASDDNDSIDSDFLNTDNSVSCLFSQGKRLDSIIWDNYGYDSYGSSGRSSQLDIEYPFNSQVADDFIITNNSRVTGVHWWGVFFGGDPPWPNPIDFNIIFYADDGTGNMPTGAGMEDPTSTALEAYFMPQVNGTSCDPGPYNCCYEYNVSLPEQFNITANTKYWIAIQAKLTYPPQWGWVTNGYNPDQLHCPVQGFPMLDVSYWTDIYYYGDMAFKLYGDFNIHPSPPVLHGPIDGVVNVEYNFWTDPVTDPSGDSLYCRWDWGDGNITEWLGPYPSGSTIYVFHSWEDAGVYDIRAKLKGNGGESNWSEPLTITIFQNVPPSTPLITGPLEGKPGIIYTYEFMATVNEGDTISYYIDWGDNTSSGWIGPYLSGAEQTVNHSWAKKGTYIIKIKAMDCLGIESDWGTLKVKIPKSYNIPFLQSWMRLLERFPNAFPILRYVLMR
jgi:hypothetical protein